jgi:hypothetical protein
MHLRPSTSRRFVALVTAVAMSSPAAGQTATPTKDIPLYCKLLNQLPPHQQRAYLHNFQNSFNPDVNKWTPRDDARMDEQLRMLEIIRQIPLHKRFDIDNAFLNAHPDWKRDHETLIEPLTRHPPDFEQRSQALFDHVLKVRRQIRHDCQPNIG